MCTEFRDTPGKVKGLDDDLALLRSRWANQIDAEGRGEMWSKANQKKNSPLASSKLRYRLTFTLD